MNSALDKFEDVIELIKISDINKPINGITLNFINYYWIVKNGFLLKKKHGAYCCNEIEDVLELQISKLPLFYENCEVIKIPAIFLQRTY